MPADKTRDFSAIADELLAAWETGQMIPDLSGWLHGGGLSPEQIVELFLADQSFRWRTAELLRVEDYLGLCPVLAQQPDLVLELAYGEIRTRQQLGAPPTAEEIEARFPHLAPRLKKQLEVGFWLDEGTASSSPVVSDPTICPLHRSGRFGPYELGEAIAHGGMGVVFRARHVRLNRVVALKMIRRDRITREVDHRWFHNETITIAQLDHPHIVPIYDVGEVDGVHYFTMKLMEGGDLQQQCRRYLDDPQAAVRVMMQVAEAVHHAHLCGVLHRDVKPSNILLDHAGTPCVTDFGLARRLDDAAELTQSQDLMGTPAYLAPEQLAPDEGPLTIAADVYGLGAVLYVLLTGKPPFEDEHLIAMLESIRKREPAPPRRLNPRVDRDLEQVCLKALAKRPADRYLSAREFADDLQRFLAGGGVRARPLPWWRRRWRWVRRHPDLAAIGAVILTGAAVLLTLLGWQTVRLEAMRRSLDSSLQAARAHQAEADVNRLEAARLRHLAEQQQAEAGGAREEAVAQRQIARKTAYAAAIHHVEMAWKAGDTTEFSRLLDEQVPAAGEPDMRGFEWFVFDRLYRPRPERFSLLRGPARSVRYSPDGRLLAAAGDPGLIQILDANAGRVLTSWPSLTTTRDLAFSLDGALLAAAGDDGQVRVFPAGGGASQAWSVSNLPVWQVAFVGEGPLLATLDQDGIIRLWDHRRGEIAATLPSEPKALQSMAVAPDGKWLVSGDRDGMMTVWDLTTRQVAHQFLQDAKQQIKCLAISPDGTAVATGSTDNQVRVIRLHRPWHHQWILFGQLFDRPQGVAFSADGRHVAGCDKNGSVRVWRLPAAPVGDSALEQPPSPPEHAWQAHQGRGYAIAFHPRQAQVATGGQENHVAVWELRDTHTTFSLGALPEATPERSLVFSPDGSRLAAAAQDGVQLWNVQTRKLETRLSRSGEPRDDVAIARDGRYLAAGRSSPRVLEVWRKTPDGYRFLWEAKEQARDYLAFSPQGDFLAVADWGRDEVAVFESATGRLERTIAARQCWGGEFSPDGRQFAFTEEDDVVVWDWPARRPLRRLRGHLSTVTGVSFSPDGLRLASCGKDRRINLWNVGTGDLIRTMMGHRGAVLQAVFVGNDRLVSLAHDGTVLVWHAELGSQLCSLREDQTNPCFRLAVSSDRHWLACRLGNGDVQLFDLSAAIPRR